MSDLITVQSSTTNDSCVTSLLPLESLLSIISQGVLACVLCVLGVGFIDYSSGTRLLCRDSYYLLQALQLLLSARGHNICVGL